jgi:hypothetical protein
MVCAWRRGKEMHACTNFRRKSQREREKKKNRECLVSVSAEKKRGMGEWTKEE